MFRPIRAPFWLVVVLVLVMFMALPTTAFAQCTNYTVSDANALNDVITAYNQDCSAGEEIFATIDGTITLQSDSTEIDNATGAGLILTSGDGPGILDGNDAHRILDIANGNVVVEQLTLRNAESPLNGSPGGAIANADQLSIRESTFASNHDTNNEIGGGAIFNEGTLTIERSTFRDNDANTGGPCTTTSRARRPSSTRHLLITRPWHPKRATQAAMGPPLSMRDRSRSNTRPWRATMPSPTMAQRCTTPQAHRP